MGAPAGEGASFERPAIRVKVGAFCIDRTEVTVEAYVRCAAKGACEPATSELRVTTGLDPHYVVVPSRECNASQTGRDRHPVNCVSQAMATAYCKWAGGRLPREAEWELSARGSDGRRYPWGTATPGAKLLNALGLDSPASATANGTVMMYRAANGYPTTAPVGSFPDGASPFGLVDVAGNVDEWLADGAWTYADHTAGITDPSFPLRAGAIEGAMRGGSWATDSPSRVAAYARVWGNPAMRDLTTGFRCAR